MFSVIKKRFAIWLVLFFMGTGAVYAADDFSKEQSWESLAEEVDTWGDLLGYPIDAGIKEVVIGLNITGFETIQSCEGHLVHGRPYPWVMFLKKGLSHQEIVKEMRPFEKEYRSTMKKIREENPELSRAVRHTLVNPVLVDQISKKYSELFAEKQEAELKQREPLSQLLTEFYLNHKSSYDNTLVIFVGGDFIEIRSLGVDFDSFRTSEERALKLVEYQDEMRAFGAFLKARFLDTSL